MADVDVGYHSSEIGDVNTYHYMGKLGFDVVKGRSGHGDPQCGAGVMAISPAGGESLSYFAINAGAKIGIKLGKAIELLISPQGDIAFSNEDEVLTSKAWIWPLGLGLRVSFDPGWSKGSDSSGRTACLSPCPHQASDRCARSTGSTGPASRIGLTLPAGSICVSLPRAPFSTP
jgi:hypothetical protein